MEAGALENCLGFSGFTAAPDAGSDERDKAGGNGCEDTEPTGAIRLGSEPVGEGSTRDVPDVANGLVKGFSPKREESLLQAAAVPAKAVAAKIFKSFLLAQD